MFRKISILAVLGAFCSVAFAQPESGKKDAHHTKVSLLSEVKTVQPGVPFTVGILMKMDKDWHTYWKNPGESGLPTEIAWKLPAGFTAGEIQWPLPHKYNESGDVLTYGYENESMLLVEITPATNVAAGSRVTLKADVSWLECEKLCVPGSASVELQLSVAADASEKINQNLLAKYRSQIPLRYESAGDLGISSDAKNGTVTITLQSREKKLAKSNVSPDFYPEPLDPVTMSRTEVAFDPAETKLSVRLSSEEKIAGPKTLKGVVVYQLEGGDRRGIAIDVPLSEEFCSTLGATSSDATTKDGGFLDQKFTTIETAQQQPLYMYILFAIIGGLLLNIMPCVLPVIALKIFGLVKMAGNQPRQIRKLGWFFSLGILASFLSIALVVLLLKSAGESVGWGFQFQEPLFVIAMSTIVFAFGLSLFGVFEITVPSFAVSGVSRVASKADSETHGFAAPFAEGVFATILATPCTAPFLGSAMGFAFSQPAYIILILFAAVAFGMALPYLILTTKPAWMKFLPKPGEWMVTAKQFMGFLMMATLLWLLHVLGSQLGMEAVVWTGAFLLFVGIACWMIGRFATLTATRARYFSTWAAALLLVVAGYMFFIGDILKARDVLTSTAQAGVASAESSGKIAWEPFTVEALETHLGNKRTVFIDFTAEWCLTCKVNEKSVLADQSVIDAVKQRNIVAMKADWTTRNETITKLLAKFGRSGVPLYVVFPKDRPTEPIVLPEVITTGIVLDALEKAG
ncbi:MAG: thioredoxin family protein [Ignavibacteriae bacterium]|nr:thioredoxin family protein [Ignavibacteriota bacterium]